MYFKNNVNRISKIGTEHNVIAFVDLFVSPRMRALGWCLGNAEVFINYDSQTTAGLWYNFCRSGNFSYHNIASIFENWNNYYFKTRNIFVFRFVLAIKQFNVNIISSRPFRCQQW